MCPRCQAFFEPKIHNQKYCSKKCCDCVVRSRYVERHKDKVLEYNYKYRQKNRDDIRIKKYFYFKENKEWILLKQRVHRQRKAIDKIRDEWATNTPIKNRSPSMDHPWRSRQWIPEREMAPKRLRVHLS